MWEHTLHNIEHRIKTGLGISKGKYKYTIDNPIIGPGQGSQGANGTATTMSTPLLRVMDFKAKGIHFKSPDEQIQYMGIYIGSEAFFIELNLTCCQSLNILLIPFSTLSRVDG